MLYAESEIWRDIEPYPQDEGGPNPLAAIAYSEEYSEAMSYLRAVMASNEMSARVLDLTKDVIQMNPAHYTVWLYRAKVLFALNCDLEAEIEWVNLTALKHLKNYQIWHHRQTIIDRLGSPAGELQFIARMLEKDSKNYHVWSYRQWLVQRFDLWDKGELEETARFIKIDVRNNSAWNHRWYINFGKNSTSFKDTELVEREIRFCEDAICLSPQNQSPWNYLGGVLRASGLPLSSVKAFCSQFVDLEEPEKVRSSHALDLLAYIFVEEPDVARALKALELLESKYDPIRANYWQFRKSSLT